VASTETYLDLLFRDILGQVAHNDLALAAGDGSLDRSSLSTGVAGRLRVLLDTPNRSGGCRGSASGRPAGVATVASSTALGSGNLIKRLVELARHDV
jgi:hypothetical protein